MALKALTPVPKVVLTDVWELLGVEADRTVHGLTATVELWNGVPHLHETLPLGSAAAQQRLVEAIVAKVGLAGEMVQQSLLELIQAIEGIVRQTSTHTEAPLSQATRLVQFAVTAGVELFHTPDGETYTTVPVAGHQETWPLTGKGFRRWLTRLFYEQEGKTPGAQALQDALGVLEGKALYDGPEFPVSTRLAALPGAVYVDLANPQWQAVEVTASGWHVVDRPPVKFRRPRGMLPLPVPTAGNVAALRAFLNIGSDENWRLLVAWLLAALRPTGPYPVLIIYGEQGSAKSTLVRVLRSLIDPNTAALRTTPRDERDLVIAARNSWLIALDNLSHLAEWLSDALCRLATGSGFATRELYSNDEETIFTAQRPIVVNGIEELATRGDLLDRAIVLYLQAIPESQRREEHAFWQDFHLAHAALLGALLESVSQGLQALATVQLDRLPRMADFARWGCATAPACGWTAEEFLTAYRGVREAAHDLTLEAAPVATPLRLLAAEHALPWEGTASELLAALATRAGSDAATHKAWPKNGQVLSNILRRLAPTLRAVGTQTTFYRLDGGKRQRMIRLSQSPAAPTPAAGTPQAPAAEERDVETF